MDTLDGRLLIGGERREGRGELHATWNPATGRMLESYSGASSDDLADAVAAAVDAASAWSATPQHERATQLDACADAVEADAERICFAAVSEVGMLPKDALGEIAVGARGLRTWAESARLTDETSWRALGSIAVISPWSSPIAAPLGKLGAALAGGNSVVWKPAPYATYSAFALVQALTNLPSGTLNLVLGGDETAAALTRTGLDAVSFTGSRSTAAWLAQESLDAGGRFTADVEGEVVAVVLHDTDVEVAAREVARGAYAVAGQRSAATKLVVAESAVAPAFREALIEHVSTLEAGDPAVPGTAIGPLIDATAAYKVDDLISGAVADGARILVGGRLLTALGDRYYAPTILEAAGAGAALRPPVAPLIVLAEAAGDEQLVQVAKRPLGLAVFTADQERAARLARSTRALAVRVNGVPEVALYERAGLPRVLARPEDVSSLFIEKEVRL